MIAYGQEDSKKNDEEFSSPSRKWCKPFTSLVQP